MFGRWEREGEIGGGVGRYGRGPMFAFFVFGRWERAGETGEGVGGYGSRAGYPPNMKNANVFAFFVFGQRIAAEIEKRATNGAFFMFGDWAWHSWGR